MFQIHSIKNLLNIKDKNIFFTQTGVSVENFKGISSKIIHAKLSYSPDKCPHCQAKDIIKWGSKTSNIRLLKVLGYNTILRLQKQRFRCKECEKTFVAETDLVEKYCSISNDVKLAITLELQKNISEKDIASNFNVSPNTVNRIINSFFKEHLPSKNYLPEALCFDEFKATKDCEGAMAFIYCDANTGKIINILPKMKTSLKTFKKYLDYIENSLNYHYNNGLIEGINRKIKTLKRSAYGYKSFYHFRARILINNNLLATK